MSPSRLPWATFDDWRQDPTPENYDLTRHPLFVSGAPSDKFWREYRIYPDRVELETVLGVLAIPFDEIEQVADLGAAAARGHAGGVALLIERKQGWIRRVCIRPHEGEGFRNALEHALSRHRALSREH